MFNYPVVLLNGGRGYFSEKLGKRVSKGSIEIEDNMMAFHVIRYYVQNGFNEFIILNGFGGDDFVSRFSTKYNLENDGDFQFFSIGDKKIKIRFIDTGNEVKTWDRLKFVENHINSETFALSYTDTLTDLDLELVHQKYLQESTLVTLTGVNFPVRFRVLGLQPSDNKVKGFTNNSILKNDFINGGFYFINQKIFEKYKGLKDISFEEEILNDLLKHQEISCHRHSGLWRCMDSDRDLNGLIEIISKGK